MTQDATTGDASLYENSVFLFDGSAIAYRAHSAMSKSALSSPKGVPTGATYGFTTEIKRIVERVRPRLAAVVFDRPEPTFRHALYPEYKAHRAETPVDLVQQLPWMKKAADVLGFKVLEMAGFEADDIIGTLARRAEAAGMAVFIVTGDKDFMQLVSERIKLYNIFRKNEEVAIIDTNGVREKFRVAPSQVADVLALMGDASDNIPGIPAVGEKGASKLINAYGSIEALLDHPGPDVSPRIRESLLRHREDGLLSKRLATIDIAVPIDVGLEDLAWRGPRPAEAFELFQELGFRTLANAMAAARTPEPEGAPALAAGVAPVVAAPAAVKADYRIIRTRAELEMLLQELRRAELVAVDTETTGLDALNVLIVGFSFSFAEGSAAYVPMNAQPPLVPDQPGSRRGQAIVEMLRPFLEDPAPRKCGQNVKYDLLVMRKYGIHLRGVRTDTMIASFLVEPEHRERNLDALALRHFGHVKIRTEELIGKGKNQITMDLLPIDDVGGYACEDADFTFRLARRFLPLLAPLGLERLHDEVEIPLIDVLASMEEAGVRVDRDRLRGLSRVMEKQVAALETEIHALAGREFKVNSPRELGKVLFDELKLAEGTTYKPKKNQTGWVTAQEELDLLAEVGGHPLPSKILEYRMLAKLLSTYVITLPELVDEETGRIHTSYSQAVAATGRLSSYDPNLQNIPIRSEAGKLIRAAFVPADDDHVLVSADYSQVELRILAAFSEDPGLKEAFQSGADIHRDTAARVFGIPRESVDATTRSRAKAINFGILYGMGPQRLARETGLTMDEARAFIDRYFAAFPAVRGFIESKKEEARGLGYVTTLLGRRRPIPDILSTNRGLKVGAENMAVNTPIQGTAADILKVAMIRIQRALAEGKLAARMILTVHDELVFDVPKTEVEALSALVRREMVGASTLSVPLEVEIGVGASWLEAH